MAYSRYATELKDKDNNIYGIMDAENREETNSLKSAFVHVQKCIIDETNLPMSFSWEHGGIDNQTGETNNDGSTTISRDITYYDGSKLISITNGSSSLLWLIFYTYSGGTYTWSNSVSVSAGSSYNFATDKYVRFDIRGSLYEASFVTGIYKTKTIEHIKALDAVTDELELPMCDLQSGTYNKSIDTKEGKIQIESFTASESDYKIRALGKNLAYLYFDRDTYTTNGITFDKNSDGSVRVHGTAEADVLLRYGKVYLNPGNYYKMSSGVTGQTWDGYSWQLYDTSFHSEIYQEYVTAIQFENDLYFRIGNGTEVDETFYCMVEEGKQATTFEKCNYSEVTIHNNTITGNGLRSSNGVTYVYAEKSASVYILKNVQKEINDLQIRNDAPGADGFIGHLPYESERTDFLHIICYGQSLSVGADSVPITTTPIGNCYTLDGWVRNYTGSFTDMVADHVEDPIVSAVNSFATLYRKYVNKNGIFIGGAYGYGGQSIAQLMSTTRQAEIKTEEEYEYNIDSVGCYNRFLTALQTIKTNVGNKSVSCPCIVYLQGERDYTGDTDSSHAYACNGDKSRYKLYMSRLKGDMQSAVMSAYGQKIKPMFMIYQCSGLFIRNKQMTINQAQQEFAEENDDVILLPAPYFTPNYSSAHLSSNGYRWLGEYIAKEMFRTVIQRSKNSLMKVVGAKIKDEHTIAIKVRCGKLPIVIDTDLVEEANGNGYGFMVYKDDWWVGVTGISIFGDEIEIKTNATLTDDAKIELVYASDGLRGSGNIRDSEDCYYSMYTYWNDANDKGTDGTLTIEHRPLDSSGNPIYGQHYPMYNWLQPFYLLLNDPS